MEAYVREKKKKRKNNFFLSWELEEMYMGAHTNMRINSVRLLRDEDKLFNLYSRHL